MYQHVGEELLRNIEVFKTLAQFSGDCEGKEESLPKRQSLTGTSIGVKYHHILEKAQQNKIPTTVFCNKETTTLYNVKT